MMDTNPFRNPNAKPTWAQLTRLAGDRVAILFEELRSLMGRVDGLIEELHYTGPEAGWAPSYRVGEEKLFWVSILPGSLVGHMEIDQSLLRKTLASRVGVPLKKALHEAQPLAEERSLFHLELTSAKLVRAFARLAVRSADLRSPRRQVRASLRSDSSEKYCRLEVAHG